MRPLGEPFRPFEDFIGYRDRGLHTRSITAERIGVQASAAKGSACLSFSGLRIPRSIFKFAATLSIQDFRG
jgi:hypothetical protein